jgi:serine/threonine protein phosphatase PrpC
LRQDLVTAEPDIFEDLLSPHDQFILLACDGLWDVFGNQEAVDFVRAALPLHRPEEVPCASARTHLASPPPPHSHYKCCTATTSDGGANNITTGLIDVAMAVQVMRRLIGEALGRGSMDNISCLLVLLPSAFSTPVPIPSGIPLRISMDLCSSV